ncbi:MAG TPA: hypothetical protein VF134_05350 [Candidatus Dormibacteraeota bacterium]
MRRILLAVGSAVAMTVGMATGVSADNGATVQHINLASQDQCFNSGPYSYCFSATGEETITQTPTGNWSGQANGTETSTFSYNGTAIYSSTANFHVHILYKDNFTVLQEAGEHETGSSTYGGTTCTYSFDLHITNNNQIQYQNYTFSCS